MKKRIEQIEHKLRLNEPHIVCLINWYGSEPLPPEREVAGIHIRYVRDDLQSEKKEG